MRFVLVSALVICANGNLAAQSCPAIDFLTTAQLAPSGNADLVAVRQADGSFTGYGLAGSAPLYTTPNIQNSVTGCISSTGVKGPKAVINFTPAGVPSEPGAIVDLNGNGTPELLVAETGPGIDIYWDFNLSAPDQLLPQITTPAGVQVADLNGDGKPDIIALDGGASGSANNGGVYVLLNNGDKTFKVSGHYLLNEPGTVGIADINGDGKPDMIVGQQGTNSVAVFLGNGDGTFQNPSMVAAAGIVISVLIADFNRDGKMDLAVNTLGSGFPSVNPIAILLGDSKGNFSAASTVLPGGDAMIVATGDFNGDGIPDLATGNFQYQTVSVMLGAGDGSFGSPTSYAVPFGPNEIAVTDFNNDGIADIAIGIGTPTAIGESENSNVIGVLLGNGDGTFQGAPTYHIGQGNASFLAVADFNSDGNIDAIVQDQSSGAFDFFAGKGDGTFQAPVVASGQPAGPAAVGDFNGDGKPDLAIAGANGIQILLNSGAGSFQSSTPLAVNGTAPTAIVAADFNGDGKLDLAVAIGATVEILTGGGNGTFTLANTYTVGSAPASMAVADVNGDGKPDLLIADAGVNNFGSTMESVPGAVYVLLNQGGGAFQIAGHYPVGVFPTFVVAGDVNKDGKPDLVVLAMEETSSTDFSYEAGVLLGNGNGTFQAATTYPINFGPSSAVIANFNSDGKPDIVIAHCCGDTEMGYLLGHGDGTFDPEVLFNGGGSPSLLAVADINKDGRPDLLVAGSNPSSFTPLVNVTPAAVSQLGIALSAPAPARSGVAADSIASAYGSNLGTSISGTSVSVKDSAGVTRAATVFFVSPGQVNFEIPAGTANGTATVTISGSTGTVQVNTVAPGIYTANAAGVASALAFSYKPDVSYTYQDTAVVDASTNQVVANPISLDPSSNTVLELYGTGLRHAASGTVSVKVGSVTLTPQYSGAQGQDAGLDQVNVVLPYSLKGSGDVAVTVTADGVAANTVHVTIE